MSRNVSSSNGLVGSSIPRTTGYILSEVLCPARGRLASMNKAQFAGSQQCSRHWHFFHDVEGWGTAEGMRIFSMHPCSSFDCLHILDVAYYMLGLEGAIAGDVGLVQCLQYLALLCYLLCFCSVPAPACCTVQSSALQPGTLRWKCSRFLGLFVGCQIKQSRRTVEHGPVTQWPAHSLVFANQHKTSHNR